MPIPSLKDIYVPLLKLFADGQEHSLKELISELSVSFALTEEEKTRRLRSGGLVIRDRISWAKKDLELEGLLEKTARKGIFRLSAKGHQRLQSSPERLTRRDMDYFNQCEPESPVNKPPSSEGTPLEIIDAAYVELQRSFSSELLGRILECSPEFFEALVVNLLVKMGYGGSQTDAGRAIGRSGDGGVDGIIKADRLGLDCIHIQAKRWSPESIVGRPEIQRFAGALQGQRSRKGVFITTSRFSKEAKEYVGTIDTKIVLIDGDELAKLMIDFNIGVLPDKVYEIKRIDSDFFVEELES